MEHQAGHASAASNHDGPGIGRRVKVYWDGEGCHFQGTVTEQDQQGRVKVSYDDGDEHWEDNWSTVAMNDPHYDASLELARRLQEAENVEAKRSADDLNPKCDMRIDRRNTPRSPLSSSPSHCSNRPPSQCSSSTDGIQGGTSTSGTGSSQCSSSTDTAGSIQSSRSTSRTASTGYTTAKDWKGKGKRQRADTSSDDEETLAIYDRRYHRESAGPHHFESLTLAHSLHEAEVVEAKRLADREAAQEAADAALAQKLQDEDSEQ